MRLEDTALEGARRKKVKEKSHSVLVIFFTEKHFAVGILGRKAIKIIPHRDDIHRHTWEGAQGERQAFPFATSSRTVYAYYRVNSDERKT